MSSRFPLRLLGLALLAAPLPALACSGALHIEVEQSSVYALDYGVIVAQQPTLADCESAALTLRGGAQEVPLRVVDGGDGRFGPGDRIEWVGERLHGAASWFDTYANANVYLLSAEPGRHARMVDAVPTGAGVATLERRLHLEQENLMIRLDQNQAKPGEEPDVWMWAKLTPIDPKPALVEFDLPDLASGRAGEVEIALDFRALSTIGTTPQHEADKPPEHEVLLALNGRALAPLHWSGREETRHAVRVPLAALKPTGNRLELRVAKRTLPWDPGTGIVDVVMFNFAELAYPIAGKLDADAHAFLATGAAQPIELAWRGAGTPALVGSDGVRRVGSAVGAGRFRYAGAPSGTTLYPIVEDKLALPVALRPVAATDWKHVESGYDYLIVAHRTLIEAIAPLAAFHRRQGHRVAVIDVDEVYDQFGEGRVHPRAIRALVEYARANWPGAKPAFLLLVGDASFDIRHERYDDTAYQKFADEPTEIAFVGHFHGVGGTPYAQQPKTLAGRNLIPTWQFPSAEGQSASDNWYGAVDRDDFHPVVAVGRFPVVEPAEVSAIVDKTIDYATKPQYGAWRRDVMFITDESEQFRKASDEIAAALGEQGFAADKIYASPDEKDNLAHQSAIKSGLNDGQLLVHFLGHGGRYIWRTGPPDLHKNHDLFTLDDVSSLSNGGRLPMVLSMTCYSAPFDNPTEDSIGERFLREPGKGAVAVFAASWRNFPSPEFSKSLIDELLAPGATIGDAIVRAKRSVQDRTIVEMYNLLGDPALVLERPRDALRVARNGARWDDGVVVEMPSATFRGELTVDWVDANGATLQTQRLAAREARFGLAIPPAARKATEVRVYALDSAQGRDAVGALDLRRDAAPASALAAWISRKPPRAPLAPDTIARLDFDENDVEVAAKPAPGSARAQAAR